MESVALRAAAVTVLLAAAGEPSPRAYEAAAATAPPAVPVELPGQLLPVKEQHTYRMAGRVRFVLFWVARDDVGQGVITWRESGGVRAYELLIGTSPERAPKQLNKWGYLIEEIRHGESSVVGAISQGNEAKPGDVGARSGIHEKRAFDTIRGRVSHTAAWARVGTLYYDSRLTSRDAPAVLSSVLTDTSLDVKRIDRADGVQSGFLSALSEMIHATIDRGATSNAHRPGRRPPVRYIHGDRVFELRLLESEPLEHFERDGRRFERVIRSRFETAEAGSRSGTGFELVYGASGALRGIPIVIAYQPRWWLHVDLVLQT